MSSKKGRFITVEGVDGAGKSTQIEIIDEVLRSRGIELVRTREPGGTPTAEKIRQILLNDPMSSKCELLMMFAARQENLHKVVRPSLDKGKWVLCDRFTDASYAYQCFGRGIPFEEIKLLENFVHPDLKPDLTVLFDIPTEVAMQRLQGQHDRFESEKKEFHDRVRKGYLKLAEMESDRFLIVDATRSADIISDELRKIFQTWN